jgi:hypothetical protein
VFDPSSHTAADLFRSDGASPADMLRYRALTSVAVPFSLSSGMNRLLPYGNPIPTEPWFMRTDHYYHPLPGALTGPEMLIFWENGVFGQNTLNLRLSRPLSQDLMMSLFANYRYFRGTRFNHERNDIVNFYRFFYADTTRVMNHGYNPLTDERVLGGTLRHFMADSSTLHTSFTYGHLQNEYALNVPATSLDRLQWALLDRRVYRIDAALLDKVLGAGALPAINVDARAAFISEAEESEPQHRPDLTSAAWSWSGIAFGVDADFTLPNDLGVTAGGYFRNIEYHDGSERFFHHYRSDVFYTHRFRPIADRVNTALRARMEMIYEPVSDTVYTISPIDSLPRMSVRGAIDLRYVVNAALVFLSNDSNARLTLYFGGDPALYDTPQPRVWLNNNTLWGAEGQIRSGYLGLLVGYQHNREHAAAWPQSLMPYVQPGISCVIAPWIARYRGVSLLSRAVITDTKPHLKLSANLSYLILPAGMQHTFEAELGFDYWSERDPRWFAGHYGWNEPVYDLNLKITAHIRTFRLFYKVDNLLNRRQAYVPGYFSPGLTFRWGLNWFLQ